MTDEIRPVLDQINLVVSDMTATVEFYRRLGLAIGDVPPEWDQHHRSADMAGGIDLDFDGRVFAKVWNVGLPEDRPTAVIGFKFPTREAVDASYEDLTRAGYVGQQPPFDAFWGARYAIVEDPDGNSVGLMSPVDPTRRSPMPPPA
jgi:catechol 2,3-dioxygenase-like lactoylglutathione lyase family enzyme